MNFFFLYYIYKKTQGRSPARGDAPFSDKLDKLVKYLVRTWCEHSSNGEKLRKGPVGIGTDDMEIGSC